MNRAEMIRKAGRLLADYDGLPTPDSVDESRARIVLDAVLPQVSTVADLEALSDPAIVLDSRFITYDWIGIDQGFPCLRERHNGHILFAHVVLAEGPLTVVWTPEASA